MTYQDKINIIRGDDDRTLKILDLISTNEPIHHNALKERVLQKKIAAIQTYDKKIAQLLRDGIIKSEKIGNKKYYSIKKEFEINIEKFELGIKIDLAVLHGDIRIFERTIDQFDQVNISAQSFFILKSIIHTSSKILILCSLNPQKKIEYAKFSEILEKHVKKIFKILKNNKNAKMIYPLVLNNLFPAKREETMNPNLK